MTTMNISLPKELKVFIDKQVKSKRYGTSSEYVRHLIRSEEIRDAENNLKNKILEGVSSGYKVLNRDHFSKKYIK